MTPGQSGRKRAGKNMGNLRQENRSLIVNQLYYHGRQSRTALARSLALTPASITMTVNRMIAEGILSDTDQFSTAAGMGRRQQYVDLNCSGLCSVGITMVTERIEITISDLCFRALRHDTWNLSPAAAEDYARVICDKIAFGLYAVGKTRGEVIGIGVTIRGFVDPHAGISEHSFGLLPDGTPIRSDIESLIGIPVSVDNHIRSLMICEALRSRRWMESSLFIRFGPGISSAITIHGQLYTGTKYLAGEIGHVVLDPEGPLCRCGKRGCLETYSSFRVMRDQLACPGCDHPEQLLVLLEQHDGKAVRIFTESIDRFLLAASNMAVLFDPEHIVLYGDWLASNRFVSLLMNRAEERHPDLAPRIHLSEHNLQLEKDMACALAVRTFLDTGACIGISAQRPTA